MDVGDHPHVPVLLDQVLEQLAIRAGGIYIDGTFGRGGHSRAILDQLDASGRLLVIDRDPEALAAARMLAVDDPRVTVVAGNFGELERIAREFDVLGQVDGIVLDLGVSSPQLENAERGFSFMRDGPLDMRMDPSAGVSAGEWLNSAAETELARVMVRFGEEPAARRIARAIVRRRESKPITRTGELAELIESVVPRRGKARHPATRSFQAIRIYINDELGALQSFLNAALGVLRAGGRLCVISFHSLEDRMVKRYLRDHSRVDPALASLPIVPPAALPRFRIPVPAIRADLAEAGLNPRARSAVLRAGIKQ